MGKEILLFEVDHKRFGVPSETVKEVLRAVRLSPLPQPSPWADGLLNLRGQIVPVLNLRAVFGMAAREIRHTDHLIVVEGEQLLTLRVDRATDLVGLEESDLQPAGTVFESRLVECLGKVGAEIVQVLDVDQLAALEEAGGAASTEPTNTEPSP